MELKKLVVVETENVKRKAQEDLQENRPAQRELEEQNKSKSDM